MAVTLDGTDPGFRHQVEILLAECLKSGVEMRPYAALRKPQDQAKLWRQSRSIEQIEAQVKGLRAADAPYLADVLEEVGPQHGPHVTNALPGLSWHQWGEAVDCFWALNGQAEWSTSKLVNGLNGYRFYADRAKAQGLTAGGFWPRLKDWAHVQLRPESSPLTAGMILSEIDAEMRQRFG